MKIISYNINGIRLALKKGWQDWLQATDAEKISLNGPALYILSVSTIL